MDLIANLFDPDESDIGRGKRELPDKSALAPAISGAPAKRPFGWWLYAAGAALLLLEWVAWRRSAAYGAR